MFFDQIAASEEEIAGQKVKMLFTLGAAAKMESELQTPYPELVLEFMQLNPEGKKAEHAMAVGRQAKVIRILMAEAGQAVTEDDLKKLHMLDFAALARMAQREMVLKSPSGNAKKNAEP